MAFDHIFAGLFNGHQFLYVLYDNLATIQENMPDSYFEQDSIFVQLMSKLVTWEEFTLKVSPYFSFALT